MTNPNTNCLRGMRCPKCGSYGPFQIECTCLAEFNDDGTLGATDFDWDDHHSCFCVECDRGGQVKAFKEVNQ